MAAFEQQFREWSLWAASQRQDYDGWESAFPQWEQLMIAAFSTMQKTHLSENELSLIARCFEISEETEDLQDMCKQGADDLLSTLEILATHRSPRVRWQAFELLGLSDFRAEALLSRGLNDADSYCRRRAARALSRIAPEKSAGLIDQLLVDSDPYVRQETIEIARLAGQPALLTMVIEHLQHDPVQHVRAAAGSS